MKDASGLRTLLDLIEALPEYGDRPAVLAFGESGVERWTYAELAGPVGRLAGGLVRSGVGPGEPVALLAGNGPGWVLACLAIVEAGAVAVPLDEQLDDGTLLRILDDSAARLVFTTAEGAGRLRRLKAAPQLVLLDAGEKDERSWRRLLAGPVRELPRVGPEDPAALFYTSGTTGAPRGVPLSHANLAFQVRSLLEADLTTADDRFLLPLPLHHVYPFVVGMLAPLSAGLPIVVPRSLAGPEIARALREGSATWIVGVPRLYAALYAAIEGRARSSGPLGAALFGAGTWLGRSQLGSGLGKVLLRPVRRRVGPRLKILTCGGAALDPGLARRLESFGWRVVAGYGLTETSPLLTLNLPDGRKLESVGRLLPGTEARAVPLPGASPGEGELLVRGPGVFSSYRNRPEETGRAFDEGWFRTGDLGRLDEDGYLYVTGRASTLIVTGAGKNVQPEEVEDAYLKSPVIGEIGVLQRDGRLVALILPDPAGLRRPGKEDVDRALRDAVGEVSSRLPPHRRLSGYAVTREPLEYTRLGKLRRHLLEERYDQAKRGEGREAGAAPIPPETMSPEDRSLLENPAARQTWDWLAHRYPEHGLTPDTSPQLDLGFDSMQWIQLSLGIGEDAGARLDETAMERIITVRDLLREVVEGPGTDTPRPSPLESPERFLSGEQRRWLEPLGLAASAAARALFALNRAAMGGFFRLRVEGAENLPGKGPFVLVANHPSYLDAFAVAAALDRRLLRRTYWGSWMGLAFEGPVARRFSRLARLLPVADLRVGASSLALPAAVLERGDALVWFPEGYRSYTGELQPFKPGVGVLLDHFRAPVVPAFVRGSYEALPRGRVLPRPRRVTVVFGRALDVGDLDRRGEGASPQDRITQALRASVAKLDGRP